MCDATTPTLQVGAKAYPTIQPLLLAKAIGRNAVVGSICRRETKNQASELFGYRPFLDALVDRMASSFVKPAR